MGIKGSSGLATHSWGGPHCLKLHVKLWADRDELADLDDWAEDMEDTDYSPLVSRRSSAALYVTSELS